ncbi:hypothetical protein ENBRE01_0709 [Enteropsectra breve]|nr:hypothetical protein ENBRE01_0709 [Enteropsectra breve]
MESSVNRRLKCSNHTCNVVLKSNDINRLFAHLLYSIITNKMPFKKFKKFYARFINDKRQINHTEIMNILINSHSLKDFGQLKLWDLLAMYFEKIAGIKDYYFRWYYRIVKAHDDEYESILHYTPHSWPETEIELIVTARILRSVHIMCNLLSKIDHTSTANLLDVYQYYVVNENDPAVQEALASHFMDNIMRRENPFKCMENIYLKIYHSCMDLVIEEPLTSYYLDNVGKNTSNSDFLRNVLAELGKNNIFAIEIRVNTYLQNANNGVFIPIFINYFEHNGMTKKAEKIVLHQLGLFKEEKDFQGMSIKKAIEVFKAAFRLKIFKDLSYIDKMLCKVSSLEAPLAAAEISCISLYFQEYMPLLTQDLQKGVRDIFVKYYTTDLGKVYARCMPGGYYIKNPMMNDFKIKREAFLLQECNENYAEIAQQNHAELNALRDEFFKEAMNIQ